MNTKPKSFTNKLSVKANLQWLANLDALATALHTNKSELVRELVQDRYLQALQELVDCPVEPR